MNIVLQNTGHLAFIENVTGSWTQCGEKAHVFINSLEALLFCFRLQLPKLQMVAIFDNCQMNFTTPVTSNFGA